MRWRATVVQCCTSNRHNPTNTCCTCYTGLVEGRKGPRPNPVSVDAGADAGAAAGAAGAAPTPTPAPAAAPAAAAAVSSVPEQSAAGERKDAFGAELAAASANTTTVHSSSGVDVECGAGCYLVHDQVVWWMNYTPLRATVRHCMPLHATECHCMPLHARHRMPLHVTACHTVTIRLARELF